MAERQPLEAELAKLQGENQAVQERLARLPQLEEQVCCFFLAS